MEKALKHPIIPDHIVEEIPRLHTAIDTVLNLHYASHTVPPSLDKVLDTSSEFLKKKVDISSILTILSIDKFAYKLYRYKGRSGYSEVNIIFPDNSSYNTKVNRKADFINALNTWIINNPKATRINKYSCLEDILDTKKRAITSPSKITKPVSKERLSLVSEMKNESSKFKFQERNEESEKIKSNGLSLLERIKLKEKLKKQSTTLTPEMKYREYLESKAPSVYDIIFQICNSDLKNTSQKTYSIKSMIKIIKDSLTHPIGDTEIEDVLKYISERFDKRNFIILSINGVSVLKIKQLDRNEDLNVLNKA